MYMFVQVNIILKVPEKSLKLLKWNTILVIM